MALTRQFVVIGNNRFPVRAEKIQYDWTADGAGAITDQTLPLNGYLIQAITDPGATAPTANYDIVINHATGVDLLQGNLANRSDTATELVRPAAPTLAEGTCTISITNNAVANATGTLILYLVDRP